MPTPRETRRRKIVDRGNDRLAFITGQRDLMTNDVSPPLSEPHTPVSQSVKEDMKTSASPKLEPCYEITDESSNVNFDSNSISQAVFEGLDHSLLQTSSSGVVQDSSVSSYSRPQTNKWTLIMPSKISSSITATEEIRLLSSITISLVVVLAHLFNFLGNTLVAKVVLIRPLILLLLTDVTIVIGSLLGDQEHREKTEEISRSNANANASANIADTDWAESIGQGLEVAIMLQNAIRAVSMDCSVSVVLIISGLSLIKCVF